MEFRSLLVREFDILCSDVSESGHGLASKISLEAQSGNIRDTTLYVLVKQLAARPYCSYAANTTHTTNGSLQEQ